MDESNLCTSYIRLNAYQQENKSEKKFSEVNNHVIKVFLGLNQVINATREDSFNCQNRLKLQLPNKYFTRKTSTIHKVQKSIQNSTIKPRMVKWGFLSIQCQTHEKQVTKVYPRQRNFKNKNDNPAYRFTIYYCVLCGFEKCYQGKKFQHIR